MFGTKGVRDGPKQNDCGLFAIAACVSLASNGTLPLKFEQSKMRQHLSYSLDVGCIRYDLYTHTVQSQSF